MTSIEDRIKSVMSSVFHVPVEKIKDDASPDTIESWDSLKHMNLIVALEEEFRTEFNDNEIFRELFSITSGAKNSKFFTKLFSNVTLVSIFIILLKLVASPAPSFATIVFSAKLEISKIKFLSFSTKVYLFSFVFIFILTSLSPVKVNLLIEKL